MERQVFTTTLHSSKGPVEFKKIWDPWLCGSLLYLGNRRILVEGNSYVILEIDKKVSKELSDQIDEILKEAE